MVGSPKVGILALQGDFEKHRLALQGADVPTVLIRKEEELAAVDALVLPGGESTALLRLTDQSFRKTLAEVVQSGVPTLATCAGLILIAAEVSNPPQESLALLDISVARNGYGRQLDSFVSPALELTEKGKATFSQFNANTPIEGVFIRAPRITRVGPEVNVLCKHEDEPVLVQQDHILGATFHPELCTLPSLIHQALIAML